ncbi:MAG: exosortase system-associated protein, TIGR04073 family [Methylococcaceae bacterium]|nr:exosortase system-associated protein, TIGR04073 family [Methylococcaceae bacterium]
MTSIRSLSLISLSLAFLTAQTTVFAADYYEQQQQNEQLLKRQVELQKKMEHDRYVRQVGDKALLGAANLASAPLEIPKNIINVYNYPENYQDANLIYGAVGGVIKGTFEAAGRIFTGAFDLVTAPLPTKPVIQPKYMWDDFDKTNSYGPIFRLVDNPPIEPYVAPAPRPVVQNEPIDDHVEEYSQQTNENLDTMFKDKMMK